MYFRYRHEMGYYGNKLFVLGGGRSYESYRFERVKVAIPVTECVMHVFNNVDALDSRPLILPT